MIAVEVHYNLEIPEMLFKCPFCKTEQLRPGGRMIDTQMYPPPREVVDDHLKGEGENRCVKFNAELDSSEELQILAIDSTP